MTFFAVLFGYFFVLSGRGIFKYLFFLLFFFYFYGRYKVLTVVGVVDVLFNRSGFFFNVVGILVAVEILFLFGITFFNLGFFIAKYTPKVNLFTVAGSLFLYPL